MISHHLIIFSFLTHDLTTSRTKNVAKTPTTRLSIIKTIVKKFSIFSIKFKIFNRSSVTLHYDLKWVDVENTFTSGNFWYKVTSDLGYSSPLGQNNGYGSAPTKEEFIATNIPIEPNATHNYTINLTLHGIHGNQNFDQGKVFKGKIQVVITEK